MTAELRSASLDVLYTCLLNILAAVFLGVSKPVLKACLKLVDQA